MADTDDARAWRSFVCGHCGDKGAGAVVALSTDPSGVLQARFIRCPTCGLGSVECPDGTFWPHLKQGDAVDGLPPETGAAYDEARSCLSIGAHTACELVCRKILMHVAVDKGAKPNQKFASYLNYLKQQGYVTPPMEPWVKLIKDHGNEATHELPATSKDRAAGTLSFTAQLLRSVYEMAFKVSQFMPPAPVSAKGAEGEAEGEADDSAKDVADQHDQ